MVLYVKVVKLYVPLYIDGELKSMLDKVIVKAVEEKSKTITEISIKIVVKQPERYE